MSVSMTRVTSTFAHSRPTGPGDAAVHPTLIHMVRAVECCRTGPGHSATTRAAPQALKDG